MGGKHAPLEVRFWRYVDKSDKAHGCWLWTGSLDTSGYGQIKDEQGRLVRATWVSYNLHRDPVPRGTFMCHSCDVLWFDLTYRRCVRPEHLWPGTNHENTLDCIAKNRFPFPGDNPRWRASRPHGEKHFKARLTEEMVRQIRKAYQGSPRTSMRALATKYGVAKGTIQAVLNGTTWTATG